MCHPVSPHPVGLLPSPPGLRNPAWCLLGGGSGCLHRCHSNLTSCFYKCPSHLQPQVIISDCAVSPQSGNSLQICCPRVEEKTQEKCLLCKDLPLASTSFPCVTPAVRSQNGPRGSQLQRRGNELGAAVAAAEVSGDSETTTLPF